MEEMLVWVVDLKLVVASVEDSALMLFLSMLEKEENKNGGADGLLKMLPLWRKREKQSVEREKCGGEDGDQASGDSGGGQERMVIKPAVIVVVAKGVGDWVAVVQEEVCNGVTVHFCGR
jgi:hypothetical protein